MPKKILLLGAVLLAVSSVFLMFAAAAVAGGSEPVPQIATEDTTIFYAQTASKLGAPWDIVMLTDAVYATREDKGDIEDVNPIHTSLQFSIMTIILEFLTEEDGWVEVDRDNYTAKDAIIAELEIDEDELDLLTADDFVLVMNTEMEDRTDEIQSERGPWWRYRAEISANYDIETVLKDYTYLTAKEIEQTLDLYHANYLFERASTELKRRLCEIMGEYGMYQFVDPETYVSCEGVVFTGGATEVVYFNQLDPRWADAPYGTDDIGGYGCGPTAMAIVVSSLTTQTVDPIYMASWSAQNGYCVSGKGSMHALIGAAASAFGLSCSGCTRAEPQRIVDALSRGDLVVALMAKGHFTNSGHFIVLRGITEDGKILVADPASTSRSNQVWDLSLIVNEAHKSAAAGGPFWIIGRQGGEGE